MKALGRQIVVEYYGCAPEVLNNVALIKRTMRDAALVSGATVVQEAFHLFNPHGVSGVVVIAESHLAIHTWPEYGYAAVDLFTCGEDVDPDRAFMHLKEKLQAATFSAMELKRGILGHVDARALTHKVKPRKKEVLAAAE
jgi:S-adenosylmethionine decarboxylase proenzyme